MHIMSTTEMRNLKWIYGKIIKDKITKQENSRVFRDNFNR